MLLGLTYAASREFPRAARSIDRAILLQPDWGIPYAAKAQLLVAWKGDTSAGRAIPRKAASRVALADLIGHLGYFADVGFAAFLPAGDMALRGDLERLTSSDFARFPNGTAVYFLTRAYLARTWGDSAGQRAYSDSARSVVKPLTSGQPTDDVWLVWLALASAGSGDRDAALAAADRAVAMRPIREDRTWGAERAILLAQMYVLVGARDRALDQLEYLIREPSPLSAVELGVDPTWRALQHEPRFKALLQTRR